MPSRVLVVDDDPIQRRLLDNMVKRFGHESVMASGGEEAAAILTGGDHIDCVVLDLVMPDLDGFGVLARMRRANITTPVIVQTAHGGIDNAVSAMRAGALDFVVKPVGPERLQVSIRNAIEKSALSDELSRIKRSQAGTLTFRDIVTRSPKMHAVLRGGHKAALSSIPVLIEGESGVGKEMIARAIHGQSERRSRPFVAVNCGAIPDNLVESILFGHEKGAFTGATEKHNGKFVEAHGGTLFLDEVGELPLPAQVKLLRSIQESEVEPVGGRRPIRVDVRIISATNRTLSDDVKSGRFREDLFYRLNVFPVSVPPLRERAEDIPELVRHFMLRIAAEEGKRVREISPEALGLLTRHRWPGNVRQLENAVFRAIVLAESERIGIDEFPQIAQQLAAHLSPPTMDEAHHSDFVPSPHRGPLDHLPSLMDAGPAMAPTSPPIHGALALLNNRGDVRPLEDIEAEVIRFAIAHYRGQMSEVARRLRIGRSTLYRKIEHLDLPDRPAVEHDSNAPRECAGAD